MIDFQKLTLENKAEYEAILRAVPERSCEYSFANLYLWGRQQVAFRFGCVLFFSHFFGRTVYPYPIGSGDKQAAIEAIREDARQRGIPCRFSSMNQEDIRELEALFPGEFVIHCSRDSFDYVYDIHALADLKGKKLQKKRNHLNRFRLNHPDCRTEPLAAANQEAALEMVQAWYRSRTAQDPEGNYLLEEIALTKALRDYAALEMEGIVLVEEGRILALTMGSRLSGDTYDIHFEKAREDVDGAYAAVNSEFARYLREKHPELKYLNREDDMGLEGLRKAKLSYYPHHMIEKCWAVPQEDLYND